MAQEQQDGNRPSGEGSRSRALALTDGRGNPYVFRSDPLIRE